MPKSLRMIGTSVLALTLGCVLSAAPVAVQGARSAQADTLVYLDEAYWTSSTTGWGHIRSNRSVDGMPIYVAGTKHLRGLGTHSNSTIRYNVGGAASRFDAVVGLDSTDATTVGSVVFQVYAGSSKVFDSGVMTRASAARQVSVSLAGAQVLSLVVTDAGDGITWDHANWADSRLTVTSGSVLPALTPPSADIGNPSSPKGDFYDFTVNSYPERPYLRDYSQIPFTKIYLASKDAANPANATDVHRTFEGALTAIKQLDNVMLGAEKIVYLVGWQWHGHDSKYPDWSVVNPALKRPQDATALDSLRWLMREARKYHTIVSLHINMFIAFEDSPQWNDYLTQNIVAKDVNGTPIKAEIWSHQQSYNLSYKQAWITGRAKANIDSLLAMLPLQEAGTVHVDSYISMAAFREGQPISPYLGYPPAEEQTAQRTILRYWRQRGVDVTTEYDTNELKPDGFVGLEPAAYYSQGPGYAPYLRSTTPLFSDRENNVEVLIDRNDWNAVKRFATANFPAWFYANNTSAEIGTEAHSDGAGNSFYPALWSPERAVVAYSTNGYASRTWTLPPGWSGVGAVTLYDITPTGTQLAGYVPVSNNTVTLAMTAGRAVKITPKDNASTAGAPIGQTIWLRAPANDNYVVAWANQADAPLKANSTAVGNWEKFQVVDAGNGYIALRALSNNRYVVAWANRLDNPLLAHSTAVGGWERFQWIDLGGGRMYLKAASNGNYVVARPDDFESPVQASGRGQGDWERFTWGAIS